MAKNLIPQARFNPIFDLALRAPVIDGLHHAHGRQQKQDDAANLLQISDFFLTLKGQGLRLRNVPDLRKAGAHGPLPGSLRIVPLKHHENNVIWKPTMPYPSQFLPALQTYEHQKPSQT